MGCCRGCIAAVRRLFGLTPMVALGLVFSIAYSTYYSGWKYPIGLRHHGQVELLVFGLEVLLLLTSYLTAVLRGPGFVDPGWAPTAEEIEPRLGPADDRPLVVVPPVSDLLQYCDTCECYKPPRAHHCSDCGRCVLWMDHHCPWTGTCVGAANMQAFVLFTHYVAIACLHSFVIQVEVPVRLFLYWNDARRFWMFLHKTQTIVASMFSFVALVTMLLVGSLAWDLHWSLSNNLSLVEDLIVEEAHSRRRSSKETPFVFPYDLGPKGNWEAIMGPGWLTRFLPIRPEGDAIWPPLKKRCGQFDLSTEQIAQKAQKLSHCSVTRVKRAFEDGSERWSLPYWLGIGWNYGCCSLCCCCSPVCCSQRLTVEEGDWVLVRKRDSGWYRVSPIDAGQKGPPSGDRGWVPGACLEKARGKYQVPHQAELQGYWDAPEVSSSSAGGLTAMARKIRVQGLIVRVNSCRMPFTLRSSEDGEIATLLGCCLEHCDGETARWSNGEVWRRPVAQEASPGRGGGRGSNGDAAARRRRPGGGDEAEVADGDAAEATDSGDSDGEDKKIL